jgi:Cu(I)/Ag(I) efflux system protein CusF
MKSLKTLSLTVAAVAAITLAGHVYADDAKGHSHDDKKMDHAAMATDMTDGEIRKVDKDAKKVTIKHGEIKNLDMPAMTMVFQVKDPAMLDKLQSGDKIKFKVIKSDNGFVVTDLQTSK